METLRNVSYNTLEKFATALFKFINVAIIARYLGAEGQGTFSYFITVWGSVYVFGSLGTQLASNYHAARAKPEQLAGLFGTMLVVLAFLPILGSIGVLVVDQFTPILASISNFQVLLFTGIFIHFFTVGLTGLLYGLSKYREIFWGAVIQHGGMFAVLIALVVTDEFTLAGAVWAWAGCQALAGLYYLFHTLRSISFRLALSRQSLGGLAEYGLKSYPFLALTNLNSRLTHYFIAPFLGLEALGIYALALNFSEAVQHIPKAFSRVLLTDVAGTGKTSEGTYQNLSGLTLISILMAAIFAPIFIYLVFPPEFMASIPLVYILLPSSYFVGVGQNFSYVFLGKGNRQSPAKAVFLSLIATTIGCAVLIPWLGITGAALVTSLAGFYFFMLQYRPLASIEPISLNPSLSWVKSILRGAMNRLNRQAS